jgi:hypothetical protein
VRTLPRWVQVLLFLPLVLFVVVSLVIAKPSEPPPTGPSANCLAGQRLYANAQASDLSLNAQLQAYERMLELC